MFLKHCQNIVGNQCFGDIAETLSGTNVFETLSKHRREPMFLTHCRKTLPKHCREPMFWKHCQNIVGNQCFGNIAETSSGTSVFDTLPKHRREPMFLTHCRNIVGNQCFCNIAETSSGTNVFAMFYVSMYVCIYAPKTGVKFLDCGARPTNVRFNPPCLI